MKASAHTRVKVCCMKSIDEMWMATEAGASAVGLVSPMPSGPGPISNEKAAEIAAEVPPGIDAFLLTPFQTVDELVEQNRLVKARTLQLVDALRPGSHAELRRAMPGVKLVQVIHVTGPESVEETVTVDPHFDAILLDSGNPSLEVKELGAPVAVTTGRSAARSSSRSTCRSGWPAGSTPTTRARRSTRSTHSRSMCAAA